MGDLDAAAVVGRLITLVGEHYVFPEVGTEVAKVLAASLADGRYATAVLDAAGPRSAAEPATEPADGAEAEPVGSPPVGTRGGAHPRRGFRLHPHLEATIPVARAVNPVSGTNWEGTGVTPDVEVPAADALATAYRLALDHVISLGGGDGRRETLEEARRARSADVSGSGDDVLGRRQFG